MKNLFFIALILIVSQAKITAQVCHSTTQTLVKGKYQLNLNYKQTNEIYSVALQNNLPGMYHIEIVFEFTDTNGRVHEELISKRNVGHELMLFKSNFKIQQLRIQQLNFCYSQFGEDYCFQWSRLTEAIQFSKQGVEFNYANPFTLCTTEFQWPLDDSLNKQIIGPVESHKISAN